MQRTTLEILCWIGQLHTQRTNAYPMLYACWCDQHAGAALAQKRKQLASVRSDTYTAIFQKAKRRGLRAAMPSQTALSHTTP